VPAHPTLPFSCRRRCIRGLTLVELMVAVSILAVVLAIAAPSYRQFGRSTRVVTQASELYGALSYARSESMRRGVRVTVCRSADPQASSPACSTSGSWASGWLVFIDNVQVSGNVAGVVDGTDAVLRIGEPATGSTVTTSGNLGSWLAYSPQGLVRTDVGTANGAFTLCQATTGRRITVSPVGLVGNVEQVCS
jgi:type IV fimbrial biogenesis protein FimT